MSHGIHMHISLGHTAGRNKQKKKRERKKEYVKKKNSGNNTLGGRRATEGWESIMEVLFTGFHRYLYLN